MFYEIEDAPENAEAWQQLVECNHTWYWYRMSLGHAIGYQLLPKIESLNSGESFLDAIENGKLTLQEAKLIKTMITQYDILNHEGDYKQ